MDRYLRWCYTFYNQSLDCDADYKFYKYLLTVDKEAAKFFLDFHNDSSTNNPNTAWGKKRRSSRRNDIYCNCKRTSLEE